MRDVAFYFEKKSGMSLTRIRDSGLADVVIGGEGVNVTIHLVSATSDPRSFFQVKNVNVKIDSLKFSIRDSKHDLLYKTLKPLATGLVKKQIAKAIKDGITTSLGVLDDQLISVRDKMEESRLNRKNFEGEGDKPSRMSVFTDVFKRSTKSTSSTASNPDSPSSSQFKVVSNKRNSILANKGHPSGWVNRAVDKETHATSPTGSNGWESDAFNIGGAPTVTTGTGIKPNTDANAAPGAGQNAQAVKV